MFSTGRAIHFLIMTVTEKVDCRSCLVSSAFFNEHVEFLDVEDGLAYYETSRVDQLNATHTHLCRSCQRSNRVSVTRAAERQYIYNIRAQ